MIKWLIILFICSSIFNFFLNIFITWHDEHKKKSFNNKLGEIRYQSYNRTCFEQFHNNHPQLTFHAICMIESQLAEYFCANYLSGNVKFNDKFTLAMPSKIVHEYWQAFIDFDPVAYNDFCMKNLGFYLTLDDGIAAQTYQKDCLISDRLNRTWSALRDVENFDNNNEKNQFIPRLFLIDEEFKISDGYHYDIAEFQKYNLVKRRYIDGGDGGGYYDGYDSGGDGDGDGGDGGGDGGGGGD